MSVLLVLSIGAGLALLSCSLYLALIVALSVAPIGFLSLGRELVGCIVRCTPWLSFVSSYLRFSLLFRPLSHKN